MDIQALFERFKAEGVFSQETIDHVAQQLQGADEVKRIQVIEIMEEYFQNKDQIRKEQQEALEEAEKNYVMALDTARQEAKQHVAALEQEDRHRVDLDSEALLQNL